MVVCVAHGMVVLAASAGLHLAITVHGGTAIMITRFLMLAGNLGSFGASITLAPLCVRPGFSALWIHAPFGCRAALRLVTGCFRAGMILLTPCFGIFGALAAWFFFTPGLGGFASWVFTRLGLRRCLVLGGCHPVKGGECEKHEECVGGGFHGDGGCLDASPRPNAPAGFFCVWLMGSRFLFLPTASCRAPHRRASRP